MAIPRDAHVMVIGAMKSGTSTFFAHLTSHPEIAGSRLKEPEFFSEFQGHGATVERYEDLWDFDPSVHRYCAEASTGYTKYPDEPHVPDRIRAAGLEPRFIYLVRDPVDRMESHFNHGRLFRKSWAYDDYCHPALLDWSRYHLQLQQFLLRFPDRSRYRIVDFDELVSNPARLMEGVFRWLGLEPLAVPADRQINEAPQLSSLELRLMDVNLSAPLKLIPRPVKERVKHWLRKGAPARRPMTAAERERARSYLQRDIRLFGDEFGFPVEKWGF